MARAQAIRKRDPSFISKEYVEDEIKHKTRKAVSDKIMSDPQKYGITTGTPAGKEMPSVIKRADRRTLEDAKKYPEKYPKGYAEKLKRQINNECIANLLIEAAELLDM